MAFQIEYVPEFTKSVVPNMIKAGMGILEPKIKASLNTAIGRNLKYKSRSTGELMKSIRVSNTFIRHSKSTTFKANIYFDGEARRRQYVRNGEKAAYKEYGVNNSFAKQEPSFFIRDVVRKTKPLVNRTMKAVLEEELKKI